MYQNLLTPDRHPQGYTKPGPDRLEINYGGAIFFLGLRVRECDSLSDILRERFRIKRGRSYRQRKVMMSKYH